MANLQIEELPEEFLKSDATGKLNWLLAELSGPTLALQYITGQVSVVDSASGPQVSGQYLAGQIRLDDSESGKISADETALIQFSDGHVSFSAANPQVLETQWPWALRAPEFDQIREQFRSAHEQVLKDISSNGQPEFQNGERLMKSVNDLLVALKRAYPRERLQERDAVLHYNTAKRYLPALTAEATATLQGKDRSL